MLEYKEIELTIGNSKFKFTIEDNAVNPSQSHSHAHTNYELFYVWDGEVNIKTDDEDYVIKKGQAMLIAPAMYHRSFTEHGTVKLNLYFSFVRSQKHSDSEDLCDGFERTFSAVQFAKKDNAEQIGKHISIFRQILESDCFGKHERLRAELTELTFALYDALNSDASFTTEKRSESKIGMHYRYEIDLLLSQNFSNNIGLDFLSKELCLSPKRVSVIIKQLYGKTFRQVRTEMKIQVAKQFLRESRLSIDEIAEKVGYDSVRGFQAAFIQITGKTPGRYRKEKQN